MEANYWMMLVAVWIVAATVIGVIGQKKRIGFMGAFALSFLLSPHVGIIVAILSPPVDETSGGSILPVVNESDRQSRTGSDSGSPRFTVQQHAVEVLKLEMLLEKGEITKEEFEAHRSQLG